MPHGCHRSFTHLVWTTWDRTPLLAGQIEQEAYALIQSQCSQLKVTIYALGGVADHVHLLVSLPRTLCLSDFMEAVKGVSSRALNDTHASPTWAFKWQGGYSDHSVSPSQMTLIKHYIENQKEHHANHSGRPANPNPNLSRPIPMPAKAGNCTFKARGFSPVLP